jgi:fatty-acyl-CoA synthase
MVANIDKTAHQGMFVLEDLINLGHQIEDEALKVAETQVHTTDLLCIMYTSGTTGVPKGAMLTHRNIINSAYVANRLGVIKTTDVILICLPIYYIMSLTGGLAEPIVHGFKAVVLEYFDTLKCLEVIKSESCAFIYAVPGIYLALLGHPQFNNFTMESVKYGCIGGTICHPDLMKAMLEKMRLQGIYLAYGLTETSPFITDIIIENSADERLATVGEPVPGVEVCIRDPNTNGECAVNVPGEICVRGFNVTQGYYKREEATREAIDKNGWFHTGDLGHLLDNGCLVIDGRIKELIIRGGENVYPKEVENLLLAIPGVQDAQVAGIPSAKYGEEVGAFIRLKKGSAISEKEITDICKAKISFFKTPKYIFFVDTFPLSANGKVQKFKLGEFGLRILQKKSIVE